MAAQDMIMMSVHSLAHTRMTSLARDEDWNPLESVNHSWKMALAFPLIRAIPGGGKDSLKNGASSMFKIFRGTSYSKMDVSDLRRLASVMVRGGKKDLWNRTTIADSMWKVGGRKISGRKDLLDSIKNMNKKELETLMGKFNNHIQSLAKNKTKVFRLGE